MFKQDIDDSMLIGIWAKLFQPKMKTEQTYSNNNRGNQFRQSIKFNPPPLDVSYRNNLSEKTRKRCQNIK